MDEREPLSAPTPDDLNLAEEEFRSHPLDLWKTRQTMLLKMGFEPGPIDGIPGPTTNAAVRAFQTKVGLKVDGKWGRQTQAAAESRLMLASEPQPSIPAAYVDYLGEIELDDEFWACFVDLSGKSNVQDKNGFRRKGRRPWPSLKRIVWHQTSFTWTPYRKLIAEKKYTGHHKINAHSCFDTDGSILLIHPLHAYLWTANAFNKDCLSFEIMGNFEGILGEGNWYRPDTFGRARPKRIQLLRARQMTKWILDPVQGPAKLPEILLDWRRACATIGRSPIAWVNAHRAATDDRSNDCGSECWYHVAEHTLSAFRDVTEGPVMGKGQPTPPEWRSLPVVPPLDL